MNALNGEIRLIFEFDRYVLECPFEMREIPKEARFWWDSRRSAWVTSSGRCALRLIQYADRECRERILDRWLGKPPLEKPWIPKRGGRINLVRRP